MIIGGETWGLAQSLARSASGMKLETSSRTPEKMRRLRFEGTWDEHLATLSRSTRQKIRQDRRKLSSEYDGRMETVEFNRSEQVAAFLDDCQEIHKSTWKARVLAGETKNSADRRKLLEGIAENGWLRSYLDGPHPEVTPAVLDRLEVHGARAAFFIVGKRIERAPELLPEILRRGHLIGNHSYEHHDGRLGARGYYRDLKRCRDEVARLNGNRPRLHRPPRGRIRAATLLGPLLLGLRTVHWSVEIRDWEIQSASEARSGARRLVELCRPADVVLLHDDHPHVIDVLDTALPELRNRGLDLRSWARGVLPRGGS